MPIRLPGELPAIKALHQENITVLPALRSGLKDLRVLLVNLMPEKETAEVQFSRLLGAGDHVVDLTLTHAPGHHSRTTAQEHLKRFYTPWREVAHQHFDGMIVTGAPVEHLDYDQVDYWPWFEALASWSRSHTHNSLFVCWSGQALLKHHYNIDKADLEQKAFGIDQQEIANQTHALTRGLPKTFSVPVSRRSTIRNVDLQRQPGLKILARSDRSGAYIVDDPLNRATCLFNHIEYDAASLHDEYFRDLEAGTSTTPPWDYYRPGVLEAPKIARWRPLAHTLFENWLSMLAEGRQKRETVAA